MDQIEGEVGPMHGYFTHEEEIVQNMFGRLSFTSDE